MVKAGDLLFVIDPRPYRATYDSAVAQLERARASAKLAEEQYKRAETLVKTSTISVDTYDTRSAALASASMLLRRFAWADGESAFVGK